MGVDGAAITLIDFIEDMRVFRDEIMPRLERLGLRHPRKYTM